MNDAVDKLKFEIETEVDGFDPNSTVNGILLLEYMNERCGTYPDLCDQVELCPCNDDWYTADQGLEALALMELGNENPTLEEHSVEKSLRSAFDALKRNDAKYRFRIVQ